jgi:outer membrane lipase/esterase
MIFSSKASPRWLTAVAALAGLAALALTAACGGGTTQQEVFVPQRLLVFGDDNSALTQTGRKYSVNGLNSASEFDCTLEPNWVQQLAGMYGFLFAECNPNATPNPRARMLAGVGAKVSDVSAQVEAQIAAGGFRDKDLATVLAGGNDVLELYRQYPALAESTLIAEAGARGRRLALVVNRLVGLGVKVIVSDLPDMGMTPYALSERALGGSGFDRAALISRLTVAFNEQLGVNIVLDGRFVGLVQAQLRFEAIARFPASFGLANISQPICTVALPDCTTATLAAGAVTSQYLWADDTRLAPGGHAQLASLAADRAQRNPF